LSKTIENVQKDLKKLNGSILSIYLNTSPTRSDWKIRLKNGLKRTKEYIEASNPQQVKLFSKISKKDEQEIKDKQTSLTNGLICFASSDQIFLYLLQVSVKNDFQWGKIADSQLYKLFEQYPKSGVILLQHDKITLITSLLGEVIQETHYRFDLKTNHWKQYERFSFGYTYSTGSNPRDKFDRRFRENQARWYKSIIPTINRHCQREEWKNVYLAGPSELRNILKQHLNVYVAGETTRNYSGKSAHIILNKTILATT